MSDVSQAQAELGEWIARCGPKGKASTFGLVTLLGFMLVGLGSLVVGILVTPQPGSEAARPFFIGLGIAMLAIGVLCLLVLALWKNPQVDLYTGGLRFLTKRNEHLIPWDQMQKVKVVTVHDTQFSPYRSVMISQTGHKDIGFESKLEGQPDQVIDGILARAPNVEQSVLDFRT